MPKQPPNDDWLKEFDDDILNDIWRDMAKDKEDAKRKASEPKPPTAKPPTRKIRQNER